MENTIYEIIHHFIRILQLLGIPIMGFLCAVGLLILLTAGKNPRRKRAGYIFVIAFGIGILLVAYAPILTHNYFGESPQKSGGPLYSIVGNEGGFGHTLFSALSYATFFLTALMFYIGLSVKLHAGKNPQRNRLGVGIMLFSPVVMGAILILPKLLDKL